jgi:Outer membrane protein transport protein (OMPP1/FadL/TodX).
MNFKYKKIFLTITAVLMMANIVYSGPRDKFGTSAAPELLIPLGSIGTALSGTNLSYVTGIDAMFWNPAGLADLNNKSVDVMFSHSNYFADMNMEYLAAASRLGSFGVLGISVRSLNIGEIMETTEIQPEGTGTVYRPTYIVANLSLARQMTDRIKFGTNIKMINENVASVSSTGFAFDFGIQYKGGESGIAFGIAIKNLGPGMKFDGPGLDRTIQDPNGQISVQRVVLQSFDLPTNLELGVSYNARLAKQMNLGISAAFQNSSFSSDEYKFGLEYNYNNMFYLRGAFNIYPDNNQGDALFGPSFGAGLKYPMGNVLLGFDYAYRIVSEKSMNSTNQFFTLSLGF